MASNLSQKKSKFIIGDGLLDILDKIRNNSILAEKVELFCDISLHPKNQDPYNHGGKITWNIEGIAFGTDSSGGEFILLDDGSIGLNTSEGQTGRIAKNIEELFSLLLNCPCIYDFLDFSLYEDKNALYEYSKKIEEDYKMDFNKNKKYDWDKLKQEIANDLNLKIDTDISKNTLLSFQKIAISEPAYYSFYQENNGETTKSEPLVFKII